MNRLALGALSLLASGSLVTPSVALAHEVGSERGSGRKVTEARAAGGFDRIALRGSLDVEVEEGPAAAVSVTLDDNLLPLVTTEVEGKTLVIDARRGMSYRGEGRVRVRLPVLLGLSVEGSGDARIAGSQASRDVELAVDGSGDVAWKGKAGGLEVSIRGSGDVALQGAAESLSAAIDGSGDVRARELTARSARLAISGSGDIAATVEGGTLSATVDGSGEIVWYGSARPGALAVSGSGSVHHRE